MINYNSIFLTSRYDRFKHVDLIFKPPIIIIVLAAKIPGFNFLPKHYLLNLGLLVSRHLVHVLISLSEPREYHSLETSDAWTEAVENCSRNDLHYEVITHLCSSDFYYARLRLEGRCSWCEDVW